MKKKGINLLIGAVLICALGAAYFGLRSYNEEKEAEEEEIAAGEIILEIDPEEITSISFMIQGEPVTFVRDGDDSWQKEDDDTFPVNEALVIAPLDDLSPLRSERTLTDAEDLEEYGLLDPQNVITLTDADGEEIVLTIGDTNDVTGNDYLMLQEDSTVVYTVRADLRESLYEDLYDYAVSEEIPEILASDITDLLVVSSGEEVYDLGIEDAVWMVNGMEADQETASSLISMLGGLGYEGYLDHDCRDLSPYGLDEPAGEMTITWQEPVEEEETEAEETEETETQYDVFTVTFRIGDTDEEGNYYAQMEGSSEVHTLSGSILSAVFGYTAKDLTAS